MPSPVKQDLDIYRGDDFQFVTTFQTKVGLTCVAVDITGRTYRAQLRRTKDDTVIAASFSCSVPVGTDGRVVVTMAHALTAALSDTYFWDLEENAAGVITTRVAGKARTIEDVTR